MTVRRKSQMKLLQARKRLPAYVDKGIAWLHSAGYQWVSTRFLPCITIVESNVQSKTDRLLLSDAYYLLGDIHHFNNSPLAAIEAYKRSIAFDPLHAEAWRELACMHKCVGESQFAREAIAESLRLNKSDKNAQGDFEDIQELSADAYELPSLDRGGDVLWDCQELLSNGHIYIALERLEGRKSIAAGLLRLRAFGMLNDIKKVTDGWKEFACSKGRLRLMRPDWYYMPKEIYDSAIVWKTIKKLGPQWLEYYPQHNSLNKTIPIWDGTPKSMRAIEKQQTKCRHMIVEYQIARTSKDLKMVEKLHEQNPNWAEVKRLKKILSKNV